MNPATEFRIGAWATLFEAIDPSMSKIRDEIARWQSPACSRQRKPNTAEKDKGPAANQDKPPNCQRRSRRRGAEELS